METYLSGGTCVDDGPVRHPQLTRVQQSVNHTQVVECKVEHVDQHLQRRVKSAQLAYIGIKTVIYLFIEGL